ncbi:WD40 repeat domain-containing protein, partial [Aggregatibacter actinomycetemcomitans]|nr:WD40 repeat domain-containing protein [Aggregatibacter actinomycetemcomitans]
SAHRWKNSNKNKTKLVLWDIDKREKEVIAENVNTDSAYFIPDSHDFMWQSKDDNVVHIQNVDGKELASFKHFKIARHIMSADRSFYASANQTGKI